MVPPKPAACAARLLVVAMLALAHASAWPQDATASREREALRRTQQALRTAQEQQAGMQKDNAALAAEKARLDAELRNASSQTASALGQARSSRAELAKAKAELQRAQGELAALRAAAEQEREAATQHAQVQQRQLRELHDLQQTLAERTRTVARIGELLGRSTQALSDAEKKNRELHALGLKLIEAYRHKGVSDALAGRDPVFGFADVRDENMAEELRAQFDALKLPAAPAH